MSFIKLFLLIGSTLAFAQDGLQLFNFKHDGKDRSYYVAVPEGAPKTGATMVVSIHGVGADGRNAYNNYNWKMFSDANNFIHLAPNGIKKKWSNGLDTPFLEKDDDDIGFISAVISFVSKKYEVNPEKVYMVGYSGGAMMVYTYVAKQTGLIKKAAVVSGSLEVEPTSSSIAIPLVQVHGKRDKLVSADKDHGGFVANTSARASVVKWSRVNNCKLSGFSDKQLVGARPYKYLLQSCEPVGIGGKPMEYLEFKRYWHLAPFPTRKTVTDYIWKFFQSQH